MMQEKTYLLTIATIFSVITLLHLLRLMLGWSFMIGDWDIPSWLSWVGIIVAGCLAYTGFKLGKK